MSYRQAENKIFFYVAEEDIKKFLRTQTKYIARRIQSDDVMFKDEDFEVIHDVIARKLKKISAYTSKRLNNAIDHGNLALPEKVTYSISFEVEDWAGIDNNYVVSAGSSFENTINNCALLEWLKMTCVDQQALLVATDNDMNATAQYSGDVNKIRKFDRITPRWL